MFQGESGLSTGRLMRGCRSLVLGTGLVLACQWGWSAFPAEEPAQNLPVFAVHPLELPTRGVQTEEEIRHLLVGKPLYLRGKYQENSLNFNEHGQIISDVSTGSWTLSAVEVARVRLTKHRVILECKRFGLHFLSGQIGEDPTNALDRVNITTKKNVLRISIDRERVVLPKKKKEAKVPKNAKPVPTAKVETPVTAEGQKADLAPKPDEAPKVTPGNSVEEAEQPADPKSVTTTTSPEHAARMLSSALDAIFAPGLDDRMMAELPDFWKIYFRNARSTGEFHPVSAPVLRQSQVDHRAHLLHAIDSPSNELAQNYGVAGIASYHVVVDETGRAKEIAASRPIGFGLDENAAAAIANAQFEPAQKDGKPVAVVLDLVVQFRIYSKMTAAPRAMMSGESDPQERPTQQQSAPASKSQLPGPYSIPH